MQGNRKTGRRAVRIPCLLCACLLFLSGCAPKKTAASKQAETTSAAETTTSPQTQETEPEETLLYGLDLGVGIGAIGGTGAAIQHVDGIEIISGRVERMGGGMVYTPGSGSGYFVVNGTIADSSEITISIHPVSVLRYQLSLNADTEKSVRAEIRVCKGAETLVTCVQEEMTLREGTNDVDVCIDTGESNGCSGMYELQFYLDDCLVSVNTYEA